MRVRTRIIIGLNFSLLHEYLVHLVILVMKILVHFSSYI